MKWKSVKRLSLGSRSYTSSCQLFCSYRWPFMIRSGRREDGGTITIGNEKYWERKTWTVSSSQRNLLRLVTMIDDAMISQPLSIANFVQRTRTTSVVLEAAFTPSGRACLVKSELKKKQRICLSSKGKLWVNFMCVAGTWTSLVSGHGQPVLRA